MDDDLSALLQQTVLDAVTNKAALCITAGNSKSFYGRKTTGQVLDIKRHQGIIDYQPTELVIRARTGTRLQEIEHVLAGEGQMLAFEPPHFSEQATLGGTVACGLSGPRRMFTGSVRDFVLGCTLLNGKGEILRFGGDVIKNVAGFDVPRLMVGALGTLGVLLEVSLKVLPLPETERSCRFALTASEALARMPAFSTGTLPVSGLCYDGHYLIVRLSGFEKAVSHAASHLGGEQCPISFWSDLREQRLPFFQGPGDLWRISVPPATPVLDLPGNWFYDWGGALRWLKTDAPAEQIFAAARQAHGHVTLFRGTKRSGDIFQPLPKALMGLHQRIKQAFDPAAVFNVCRMYKDG